MLIVALLMVPVVTGLLAFAVELATCRRPSEARQFPSQKLRFFPESNCDTGA